MAWKSGRDIVCVEKIYTTLPRCCEHEEGWGWPILGGASRVGLDRSRITRSLWALAREGGLCGGNRTGAGSHTASHDVSPSLCLRLASASIKAKDVKANTPSSSRLFHFGCLTSSTHATRCHQVLLAQLSPIAHTLLCLRAEKRNSMRHRSARSLCQALSRA